jgi:hypothetical protein
MSELADALMNEADSAGVAPADIPASGTENSGGEAHTPPSSPPEKPSKAEKLSLRDQINKSVESVRTEEAKRARDVTTGKFVPKTEASAEKPAAAEIPTTEQNAQAPASKPVGPPSGWSKEAQALWETLPPAVKADAVRREAEVAKGFDEYRGKTAQLQEISQALEPLKPILQQSGIQTEAQAVKRLLEWEGSFRNPQTRMQAFHNLAQQYGVDLRSLVQSPSPQPSSAQEIPEPLRPVIDQFGNIVQDVNSVKQELQTLRNENIEKELRAFASKPEHAHFDKVRVLMGQLMSSGAVPPGDLDTAYQKATLIHPEVSAAIEAEKAAKAAAELQKTNAEKAARARQAAVSPSPRSPNGAPANGAAAKPKSSSVRDSLLSSIGELREGQRA